MAARPPYVTPRVDTIPSRQIVETLGHAIACISYTSEGFELDD